MGMEVYHFVVHEYVALLEAAALEDVSCFPEEVGIRAAGSMKGRSLPTFTLLARSGNSSSSCDRQRIIMNATSLKGTVVEDKMLRRYENFEIYLKPKMFMEKLKQYEVWY